jgi:hypothetical protein
MQQTVQEDGAGDLRLGAITHAVAFVLCSCRKGGFDEEMRILYLLL